MGWAHYFWALGKMPKEEGGSKACHPPAAAWDLVRGWMGRGEGKERGGGREMSRAFFEGRKRRKGLLLLLRPPSLLLLPFSWGVHTSSHGRAAGKFDDDFAFVP